MAIRPIDYNSLLPKSQELSQLKHIENRKCETQTQQNFTYEQNKIKKDLNRVGNPNKSEMTNINIKDNKKKNNKDHSSKKRKNKKKDGKKSYIGHNIDVKI